MSHCARGPHTAGPLLMLSMRNWIPALSVKSPIRPPSASMSRTIWPFATPPTAGLQLMRPMAFISIVSMAVFTPSFQAACVASMPAWPPPTTTTSNSFNYFFSSGLAAAAGLSVSTTAGFGGSIFHTTGLPSMRAAISCLRVSFSLSKATYSLYDASGFTR